MILVHKALLGSLSAIALAFGLVPFSQFGPCGPANLAAAGAMLLMFFGFLCFVVSALIFLILLLARRHNARAAGGS